MTYADPQLFALIYLARHLRDPSTNEQITFSQFHEALFERAKQWMVPLSVPATGRDCYVAPRGAGKSTMCFLILPMWAAAHGHQTFIAAFADSATQAQIHLQTFKMELDNNKLLRADYPELCAPAKRAGSSQNWSDRKDMVIAESGFVFAARGVTSSALGMKVENRRPSLLLLDDIEPQEGDYSLDQKRVRLESIVSSIFQLNLFARVVIAGTVTMHGSIVHDLVRSVVEREPEEWVTDEHIETHYFPAIFNDDTTGGERSVWPEKWPLTWLQSRRHTRDFKKNMMNQPVGSDGNYWLEEDFRYGDVPGVTRVLLSVDPAVSSGPKSDYSGLAVVGYSPSENKCVVYHAEGVKLTGRLLRDRVLKLLELYPEIRMVLVEDNQGKDLWPEVFHDLPDVAVKTTHASVKKELRFADALNHWQRARVYHAQRIPAFEDQALAYPKVVNDDICDAVCTGVLRFLSNPKPVVSTSKVRSYV